MSVRHRPSLLGGLLWTGVGILFLLGNLGIALDFWTLIGRYWPILLILLGLGKVIDYYLQKDSVSIRVGEIIGILLVLLLGTVITKMTGSHVGQIIRNFPIEIGGTLVRPGQWIGESHTYTEEIAYPRSDSLRLIRIENSYGAVSIGSGSDDEIRVRLKKVIFASETNAKDIAGQIHIQTTGEREYDTSASGESRPPPGEISKDSVLVVKTNRGALSSKNYRFNTDMEIIVPPNSDVQVRNSFGEVNAAEINGRLDLSTSHRPIEVRDCSGQFSLSNRYAECRLTNLDGNVEVDTRGGIHIENIEGDVNIADEYSPVEISRIDGKVTVSSNEGSIKMENVSKPVVINARGTRIRIEDLKDKLEVSASHRNMDISDVAADVSIKSSYATITLNDIEGNVVIASDSDRFTANGIRGQLAMSARGSGIQANDVRGSLDIHTTLKDVVVNNFGGTCSVTDEYANVRVSVGSSSWGDVDVKNRNGRIDLFLPEGSAFSIDAIARNGRIESDFEGLEDAINEGGTGILKSNVKAGGPKVSLETEYDNIYIRAQGSEGSRSTARNDSTSSQGRSDW
jgi:hypothetical protein